MATLGQQLKAAREAKGVSETEAGAATKILTRMIAAMEADDFSVMAAPTYAKGFIRLYAGYLGLNPEPLVDAYMAQYASAPKPLIDEESQVEQHRRKQPSFGAVFKRIPEKFNPLRRLSAPFGKFSGGLKPYVVKDIRAAAAGAAVLLVVVILIVSVSNCVRRRTAAKPATPPPEAAVHALLDGQRQDLYLIDSGRIERK